jgi:vacuolar-type H+-ATPase catalytic subunit A/Vma1
MLNLILYFHQRATRVIKRGAIVSVIHDLPVVNTLIRMKTLVTNDNLEKFAEIRKDLEDQMEKLEAEYL